MTYDLLLFGHLAVLVLTFTLAGAVHAAEYQLPGAVSVAAFRQSLKPFALSPGFVVAVVVLFLLGMALLGQSSERFDVGDPFVWTSFPVLAALLLDGPLILDRHAASLRAAAAVAAEGPVPADLRALALTARTWRISHLNTVLVIGVVFNMTVKPGVSGCVGALVVAAVLGTGLGQLLCARATARTA